uniref:Uncharacterized protein n=1 Tax=Tetranychus urticae TaxID=32264 RepID=T1L340_TETUR
MAIQKMVKIILKLRVISGSNQLMRRVHQDHQDHLTQYHDHQGHLNLHRFHPIYQEQPDE